MMQQCFLLFNDFLYLIACYLLLVYRSQYAKAVPSYTVECHLQQESKILLHFKQNVTISVLNN